MRKTIAVPPADIRLKPEAAEEAARMADNPIVDIDPGLPEGQEIAETSRSYLDRNEKTPRGLSFYAIALA